MNLELIVFKGIYNSLYQRFIANRERNANRYFFHINVKVTDSNLRQWQYFLTNYINITIMLFMRNMRNVSFYFQVMVFYLINFNNYNL